MALQWQIPLGNWASSSDEINIRQAATIGSGNAIGPYFANSAWNCTSVSSVASRRVRSSFTFATADLVLPQGVHFAGREVLDGVSMRIVRNYDINNDLFPCRLDILYGYKTVRPELAVRVHNN